jgi:shikimate dehydrogenase
MVPLDIGPSALESFWVVLRSSENMRGCSVTYPHKQAAFAAMDELTPRAKRLGAVNTVRKSGHRLIGDATDGVAMCSAIISKGQAISGRSAHVVGAGGGAGVAIVDELCANGLCQLTVSETDDVRREAVLMLVKRYWPAVEISEETMPCDILINATMLGKTVLDVLPFSTKAIKTASLVGDVVTHASKTQLIDVSDSLGVINVSGEEMGQHQIANQLSYFLS